ERRSRDPGRAASHRGPAEGDGLDGRSAHGTANRGPDSRRPAREELFHDPTDEQRTNLRVSPALPPVPAGAGRSRLLSRSSRRNPAVSGGAPGGGRAHRSGGGASA